MPNPVHSLRVLLLFTMILYSIRAITLTLNGNLRRQLNEIAHEELIEFGSF